MEYIKVFMQASSIHYEGIYDTLFFVVPVDEAHNKEFKAFFDSIKKIIETKVDKDSWNANQIKVNFNFNTMTKTELLARELDCKFNALPPFTIVKFDKPTNIDDIKKRVEDIIDTLSIRIADYQRDETLGV